MSLCESRVALGIKQVLTLLGQKLWAIFFVILSKGDSFFDLRFLRRGVLSLVQYILDVELFGCRPERFRFITKFELWYHLHHRLFWLLALLCLYVLLECLEVCSPTLRILLVQRHKLVLISVEERAVAGYFLIIIQILIGWLKIWLCLALCLLSWPWVQSCNELLISLRDRWCDPKVRWLCHLLEWKLWILSFPLSLRVKFFNLVSVICSVHALMLIDESFVLKFGASLGSP